MKRTHYKETKGSLCPYILTIEKSFITCEKLLVLAQNNQNIMVVGRERSESIRLFLLQKFRIDLKSRLPKL